MAAITFRRPAGLEKMLAHVARQTGRETQFSLTALVVDNDTAQSARPVIEAAAAQTGLKIIYAVEDAQGIPAARNRALASLPPDADFFCFIDDDEWPADTWLQEILLAQRATGADCLHGPVEPVFPSAAPRGARQSGIFDRRRHGDRSWIDFGATNNVLISAAFLRASKIRFDERMRFTGGSDYFFFRQAQRQGLRIAWSDSAIVYEDIPHSRLKWRWILMRHYRLGNTYAVSDLLEGGIIRIGRRFCVGVARIGLGIAILPFALLGVSFGAKAIRHAVRGAGMVAGVFGQRREEYQPMELLRDRSLAGPETKT
ncbi:MAG TPA: glycosyltransferase family 2 protein [Rhizomicrobium sp.]|nr:glycosyltransferase family 2 protein [Rhizomicrobium sp.]